MSLASYKAGSPCLRVTSDFQSPFNMVRPVPAVHSAAAARPCGLRAPAVPLRHPEGPAALVVHVPGLPGAPGSAGAGGDGGGDTEAGPGDSLELLDDATRSLALAMEGEALEHTRRETAALRRSPNAVRGWLSPMRSSARGGLAVPVSASMYSAIRMAS